MSTYTYKQEQPEAGPSKRNPSGSSGNSNSGRTQNHNLNTNPQLSSEPWFAYPTPPPEVLDGELPPYMDSENYPMGHMLDRLSRKAHGDLKTLVTETLPKLEPRQRPRHVINYATNTRQAVLKYLAVLRWKTQVDVPTVIPAEVGSQTQSAFPTPHSNGDTYSPSVGGAGIKGKGKMTEDVKPTMIRGKVTDAKRVTEYLQYQNSQHDMAVGHIQHAAKQLESLGVRNPDLLTALSLLTLGTYDRLPSDLTQAFTPRRPLTNGSIFDTLRRLDAHILYRLKCVDYVPPDLAIERIMDGRAYVVGGSGSWRAELSLTGFGQDAESRWWLTGVEWLWKSRSDKKGKGGKRFKGVERQEILDLVNREILPPEETAQTTGVEVIKDETADEDDGPKTVDAPLVRLVNFIQHLSLTYQLEVLFQQAMTLSREKWRGHLLVDIDRAKKSLVTKYWIRPRPAPAAPQGNKRPGSIPPPPAQAGHRTPMLGATITISIGELQHARTGLEETQAAIAECDHAPSERLLRLGLKVKWEIGEAGVGGGWKAGDVRDETSLRLDPTSLSIDDILTLATRDHAAHLTRHYAAPLIANRTPLIEPTLETTDSRPLVVRVPIPAQKRDVGLKVSVSPFTGLLEFEDEGAKFAAGPGGDERGNRTKMATTTVNAAPAQLGEALRRLVMAIFIDGLENQMRQLGWSPIRKLPIKLNELGASELLPASTILVPLPTSDLHYFIVRITTNGLVFELLRLARVSVQSGPGMKFAVDSRSSLPLGLLRQRRQDAKGKRRVESGDGDKAKPISVLPVIEGPEAFGFALDSQDLKDLFILSNASVAKILVEQQLKDRSIPFTEKLPELSGPNAPRSSSAVAGMIATVVVRVEDLLQDGRAADVAMPLVYLQIKDWWKGGKCQVVTILQLRHRPSTTTTGASPDFNDASTSSAARAEGITFDHASSVVKFTAKDISRCVPAFLEQWERLSKVIMVAGDVSRLNKLSIFRDLHMLSFDLRTASFSYAIGFNASITYSPNSDSYECTFTRASPVNTPATPTVVGEASPHGILAPLLSHKLNELTRGADVKRGTVGREFISLLRNTLPLLMEMEGIRAASTNGYPKLVVSSVEDYRLVWDTDGSTRHALTIHLMPNDRYLLTDSSHPSPDGLVDISCGPLSPIPDLSTIIDKIYTTLRASNKGGKVLAIKMDKGESLAVDLGVIGEVVRGISGEIDGKLFGGKGPS